MAQLEFQPTKFQLRLGLSGPIKISAHYISALFRTHIPCVVINQIEISVH